MTRLTLYGLIWLAALVCGCAGVRAPLDQLAGAQGAIRAAEEAGAREYPEAALYLKLADAQVTKAKPLIEEEENARAHMMLLRAHADAELAHALTDEQKLQETTTDALRDLSELKGEDPADVEIQDMLPGAKSGSDQTESTTSAPKTTQAKKPAAKTAKPKKPAPKPSKAKKPAAKPSKAKKAKPKPPKSSKPKPKGRKTKKIDIASEGI